MDGIIWSRGWDKEIPHGLLPMEQLVLGDKWARNSIYLNIPALNSPVSCLIQFVFIFIILAVPKTNLVVLLSTLCYLAVPCATLWYIVHIVVPCGI